MSRRIRTIIISLIVSVFSWQGKAAPACKNVLLESLSPQAVQSIQSQYNYRLEPMNAQGAEVLFKKYTSIYSQLGPLKYADAKQFKEAYTDVLMVHRGDELLGGIPLHKTPEGYKMGLVLFEAQRHSLKSLQELFGFLSDHSGWYAEVSGKSYAVVAQMPEIPRVPAKDALELLPASTSPLHSLKEAYWVEADKSFIYLRNVNLGKEHILVEKLMIGRPL